MARIFRRRPSPAMVVALVALFVAMGGVSYGVATGSIDTREIKNNTIRGKDIRTSTITGSDVGANKLTGSDIRESSLGKVPSAASADKATTADSATRVGGYRIVRIAPFTLTNNQTREILREGAFTFTARCRINVAATDFAEVLIATSENNSAFDGDLSAGDLDTNTPEANRFFVQASGATGTPSFDQETDGSAIAPSGTEIVGAELYAGTNTLNQPGTCRIGGYFQIGS